MKVVFCWSDISGYMAACWREMANDPDISLFVVAFKSEAESEFSEELMRGIPCCLLDKVQRHNEKKIEELVRAERPDIVVLCGWFHRPYRQLVFRVSGSKFVMGMDTPWRSTLKQSIAPLLLRNFTGRIDHVVCTGERSWQYATRLFGRNIPISKGLYGIDHSSLSRLWLTRQQQQWPRSFLFIGRFVPVKAVDVLVEAYRLYRTTVDNPWPLVCCGKGPLEYLLKDVDGICSLGFVQPKDILAVMSKAGVMVLPSRFDPWPLAIVEAASSGLPVICTYACGSSVEVVSNSYSGIVVPENNVERLAAALTRIDELYDEIPLWGARAQQLAEPYSAQNWLTRWKSIFADTCRL